MRDNVLTEEETRYVCSFKPAGFVRSWQALYQTKCIAGPWTVSRRYAVFAAMERGNQRPRWHFGRIGEGVLSREAAMPFGFGTLRVWWYRRAS